MRRQLLAATQNAGVTLDPVIEVESPVTALELAERGVADTVIPLPVAEALGATRRLHYTSLEPRLLETFAFVHRRHARLSPATEVLIQLARSLLADLPNAASG
jgi:DNA-binding transcriptional LysR family regulator